MRNTRLTRRPARSRNRTRTLFYAFIIFILAVIAFSLSAQIIDNAVLRQIFIAASILSVGVVIIDMLGLLGAHHSDEGGTFDSDSGHDGGDDGGDGFGESAFDDGGYGDDASFGNGSVGHGSVGHGDSADLDYAGGDDAFELGDSLHDMGQDYVGAGHGPVLEAIRYLRMFIYFCLGFGLVGLAMLATGREAQASLLFAGVAGIGSVLLARTFYRLQPKDTGDVYSENELLMERGTVIVPLSHETMGKVRVQIGMQVYEPYARAAQPGQKFARGEAVKIITVTDDCVYVEGA